MQGLSDDKIAVLRQLVLTAPDPVIAGLEEMLAEEPASAGPLSSVRAMVEVEAADRLARNAVLAPVAQMFCGPSADGRLSFPRRALPLVWRGLKAENPELTRQAARSIAAWDPEGGAPEAFDRLCDLAAQGLRTALQPDFAAASALCEAQDPDGAGALADCLDLAAIVRPALAHLSDWVGRTTQERSTAMRLAYRDAVAVADDAGPRFFEMLAGRLPRPWMVLRIISAVMDRPTERYLAASELAGFGERTLAAIDARIAQVRNFDPTEGPFAGRRMGEAVQEVAEAVAEFEESIHLGVGGPWATRLAKQRKAMAMAVEIRLKEIDEHVAAALPIQNVRIGARLVRGVPRLSAEPDPAAATRALALLAFADEVRGAASGGGFGSTRTRVLDNLDKRLDAYVEEVLDRLRTGEAEDPDVARRHLDTAAGFVAFSRDERAAQIVRRRAAAA